MLMRGRLPGCPIIGGWTQFTATEPSGEGSGFTDVGTRKIYVDSAAADDTGTGSQASPKKTIQAGYNLLRTGSPDWLLLKCGGTWTDQLVNNTNGGAFLKNGLSSDAPILVSSYGTGARPLIKTASAQGSSFFNISGLSFAAYVAIVGLELYAYKRDPASPSFGYADARLDHIGINWLNSPSDWFCIEDCKISFYNLAFSMTGANGTTSPNRGGLGHIRIRRNIFTNGYIAGAGHAQNCGASCIRSLLFEENLMDKGGFNDTISAPLTVTMPVASPGVVTRTGNIFVEGDFVRFTTTGTLPTGVTTSGTYYVRNPSGDDFNISATPSGSLINFTGSPSGTHSIIFASAEADIFRHNCYFSGPGPNSTPNNMMGAAMIRSNISSRASSHGLQLRAGGDIIDNLFLQCSIGVTGANAHALYTRYKKNVILEGKDISTSLPRGFGIEVDWGASNQWVEDNIIANALVTHDFGVGIFVSNGLSTPVGVQVNRNIVFDWPNPLDDRGSGTVTNSNEFDETGANTFNYPDPTRSVARYNSEVIGGAGTYDAFIDACKAQSKQNWDVRLTASAVNNWIRAGFGR